MASIARRSPADRVRTTDATAGSCADAAAGRADNSTSVNTSTDFRLFFNSPAGSDSFVLWERHARRRPVRDAVLIVADLPRNVEAEQVVVPLSTFHEELAISLVEHEAMIDGSSIGPVYSGSFSCVLRALMIVTAVLPFSASARMS